MSPAIQDERGYPCTLFHPLALGGTGRVQAPIQAAAYKFCWTLSSGAWRKTDESDAGYIIEGHAMLQKWGVGGNYAVGGSVGCMRSCFNYLEGAGMIEQTFHGGSFIKRPRWLLPAKVEKEKPPSQD